MPQLFRYTTALLLLILLLALGVRIFNIGNNPAGFFADEATEGYNAYSLLKTGKDEWGESYPIFFKSLGDYRNPVFIYSSIPVIAIFGLSETSVRLTSVIYGVLSVLAIYFLAKQLFNQQIALLASLYLAISPWHIHLSRTGFEIVSCVFWTILAIYLLNKSLNDLRYYPLAILALILSFFSYTTPKIYLIPLICLHLVVYFREWSKYFASRKFWLVTILGFSLVFILVLPSIQRGTFFARWHDVRDATMSWKDIVQSYLNHFSLTFLFSKGEIDFPGSYITRQSIKGMGQIYWFELPLILFAVINSLLQRQSQSKKNTLFMLLFLLIYPTSSIFTTRIPSATHSIIGVLPLHLLSAVGTYQLLTRIKSNTFKKIFLVILFLTVSISFGYLIFLIREYPKVSAGYWGWQYGFRPAMEYLKARESQFDKLLITHRFNVGEELLLFYNVEFRCHKCKIMNNPIQVDLTKKQLFVIKDEDIQEAKQIYPDLIFNVQEKIHLPDKKPEFYIGTFSNN